MFMRKERYRSGLFFKRMRMLAAFCLVVLGGCTLINRAAHARIQPIDPAIKKMDLQTIIVLHNDLQEKSAPHNILADLQRGRSKGVPNADTRAQTWEQLSPDEKARYLKRYKQLQKMSPKERKKYEKMHQQWQKLSPEERRQIRNKLKRSQDLSPQEVDTLRRRFKN